MRQQPVSIDADDSFERGSMETCSGAQRTQERYIEVESFVSNRWAFFCKENGGYA